MIGFAPYVAHQKICLKSRNDPKEVIFWKNPKLIPYPSFHMAIRT